MRQRLEYHEDSINRMFCGSREITDGGLTAVKELASKIENASHSDDLNKVRKSLNDGATFYHNLLSECARQTCDDAKKNSLGNMSEKLDYLADSTKIELPKSIVDLWNEVKKGDNAAAIKKVKIKKKLKDLGDRFNITISQLYDLVDRVAQRAKKAADSLRNPPEYVMRRIGLYATALTVASGVITIVVMTYICGNQCIMWRAPTGWCSFNTASWVMVVAAFVFLLFFPVLMVASSLGTTVGLAMDRKLCAPALDLAAPSSHPFVEFLAAKLGAEETSHRSATFHEKALKIAHGSQASDRRLRFGNASSEWRHRAATSARGTRLRNRVAAVSPKALLQRAKHCDSAYGSTCESSEHLESLERNVAGQPARKRRSQMPGADDANGGGVGDFNPPADIASAVSKEVTPKALEGVVKRFAQCSHTGLPFVQLFGKDLVTGMAGAVLGRKNPWLGLVDDSTGEPKLGALEKFGNQFPKLGNDIKKALDDLGKTVINSDDISALSSQLRRAKQDFDNLEKEKVALERYLRRAGRNDRSLDGTLEAVEKVVFQRRAFDAQMAYLQVHVNDWHGLQAVFSDSAKKVIEVGHKAKAGLRSDLSQFFTHAKKQVREHVGDCRSFYVLYVSTVQTVCIQGVTLLVSILNPGH
ncbi:hypothetical protein HPB50_024315 [Hyalomma asiaticum]|uniref:Uncharacterized protein n=1 Tax=Hyalomma asiaticum TaxID=266040 RepID=A0ACB7TB64_HYAAI|nr:hypothetical protein HPB50_024315 [Hyalomma asiaticum]